MILKLPHEWDFTPQPRDGLFIVVDGVNGGGKSTLLRSLSAYLAGRDIPFTQSGEPGSKSSLGKELRTLILSPTKRCPVRSELFLFLADRAAHVDEILQPQLASRHIILSDRYYYSTLAFQGYGRGMDIPFVRSLNEFAINNCRPDLVFLLDLPPAEGLRRATLRGNSASPEAKSSLDDRLELESLAFHDRVRAGFLELAQELPEPFVLLDAEQSAENVFTTAQSFLDSLLIHWENTFR